MPTPSENPSMRFRDRTEAGRLLAEALIGYAHRPDVIVLALPRGGVPVGFEVAQALFAPLDVFLVRKLGVPGRAELAMGAIATGGVRLLNEEVVRSLRISEKVISATAAHEKRELQRRELAYRGDRPPPAVRGRTVILVDDGLATGTSMRAAVAELRRREPDRIVVAVPVAAPSTCEEFRAEVEDVVCLRTPEPLFAVGLWYDDFSQTSDQTVSDLLKKAAQELPDAPDR
jgi:putative phosphoribosyl transferase